MNFSARRAATRLPVTRTQLARYRKPGRTTTQKIAVDGGTARPKGFTVGTTTIPPNAAEMRMDHLARANQVRCARAHLLKRMTGLPYTESCQMAADIVWDPPEVLCSMPVFDFLTRVRQVGQQVAEKLLDASRTPEQTRLGEMTPRQRAALESLLLSRTGRAG